MTSFGNVAKLGIFKAKGIVFEKWSVWGKTYIIKKQGEKILKLNYSSSMQKIVQTNGHYSKKDKHYILDTWPDDFKNKSAIMQNAPFGSKHKTSNNMIKTTPEEL